MTPSVPALPDDIRQAHAAFGSWLFDRALPVWGATGCDGDADDPARLGAREQLNPDGTAADPGFKRLRVQARQLYAFTRAALYGWPGGAARAGGIYRFMRHGLRDDGGWVSRLTAGGAVLDPTADLYDLAFIIFALSWYGRLDTSGAPVHLARQTVAWLRRAMATPNGGFLDTLPRGDGPRQQNPHMHLLEAALALFETTGDESDATLAHDLVDLFRTRLFDERTGTLGEAFTDDWRPVPGAAGGLVEPGHQYEWVWLLCEYGRLTGRALSDHARTLFGFGHRHGVDPETGLIRDVLRRDGAIVRGSARLWAQTEGLRAEIAMYDPATSGARIVRIVDNLLGRYFTGCPTGTWNDHLDDALRPIGDRIPASSFYHIVAGYAELDRLVRG
ncbi:mannose-6-phosphate isomerase [Gluconacetobacter azotocaptans]|uniref:Mannose-6-phosphate isomerase n=1 Tax=Gluconacetobacter azotocaptans TaxID=142834 RepID=A0A7W4JRB0_9PROT|nr:AGE family epimerase/isomerase [Gluconacetobacter azotocaptans]MBB2189488.1 mannose-6-phosphate isomerase [Gluconacetobacter azotocaptans]MBM9402602.1 AGE family epimerase/isomerase [Gluconacetobacter azotocaptans]GBQ34805.1 mannose-6-phosphate isomerase [Gluconacetobacter azotocaptans DSM 13594]